jgi:ATP-dependent Lon protease
MKEKNVNNDLTKVKTVSSPTDVMLLVHKKVGFFKDVVQKTILHIHKNKQLDILGISDINTCVERLGLVSCQIKDVLEASDSPVNPDELVSRLQTINNELSSLLRIYGTESLDDMLLICFGNNIKFSDDEYHKFELLKKYFHPTSYKTMNKKEDSKLKKTLIDSSDDNMKNLDCCDIEQNYKQFHMKVYGMKFYINSSVQNKSIVIHGLVDDVIVDFLNSPFINKKRQAIIDNVPVNFSENYVCFDSFMSSLTLRDYFIYSDVGTIYNSFGGCLSRNNAIVGKNMTIVIKEFITDDLFSKRRILIDLLIKHSNSETQYLAYLLYDLLSNDTNGIVDTQEQGLLFDSFPYTIKQFFKTAMKKTVKYTNELSNFDVNKIPLEQQICLLNAPDSVKEKAMTKLKEIKSKTDDSGSKSRQYLEGLLKIPFGVFKREPILDVMGVVKNQFRDMLKKHSSEPVFQSIPVKDNYTSIEVLKYMKIIKASDVLNSKIVDQDKYIRTLTVGDKNNLVATIGMINNQLDKHNMSKHALKSSGLKKEQLKLEINKYTDLCKINPQLLIDTSVEQIAFKPDVDSIGNKITQVSDYMLDVTKTLDETVFGHTKAKRQLERVIAQWITGEQTGTVLGFEGNPGLGKTTLAKGFAKCLKDADGNSRPFSMIAVGGDSNASTISGHLFTYVGSTPGAIVHILWDTKIMNPIILIDEFDKISKTEHGKEITGVFTHLLDSAQNMSFEDKYFAGIHLNMSKALFIVSYNDPESIDKILLDRIHRIKFDSLLVTEKIVIAQKHLLPVIYKNNGLEGMIHISDETIRFIIENYTLEPGVRKLKEKLFEIIGELNLNVLKDTVKSIDTPTEITIEDIKSTYFKDKREVKILQVHADNRVGVVNCLWANVHNVGGVLSASAKFFPSETFLGLRLTGLLDKMMEESFQISLTNAFELIDEERRNELNLKYNGEHKYGIHMHMGDGSISKSGTSAGIAITILLYSLLTGKKIKHDFAVTGEASDLNGKVGEIGALKTKITYGIKSGVKNFIFPVENSKDFDEFIEKPENVLLSCGIKFYPVSTVQEALELIIEDA